MGCYEKARGWWKFPESVMPAVGWVENEEHRETGPRRLGWKQGTAISESPVHGMTMKGGFLESLAAHGLGGSESATPWGLATRNGDLRIAGPWVDHEKRFSQFIGGSWAWRIGVRHSLGLAGNNRACFGPKREPMR